ncbi:HTH-type transcriptional repressor NsrR [Pseudidiomarina piscicola]|uniref:HTH-type transcriptional repressor NsrR n=1 Tax=Pseudidiomarina piscicola TaxID=2614830 RepID=A0A6S6WMH7_9GAMM|nr:Rrf2 family transcriptional regulator [Pseudidiomarina piscicola]CAB0150124.1 HTH-type transcriptional repressor NsrR [Pseudidiomarina piscicola]VZT39564.1 HTH-type transcriptional repressor NsrR [Pseudomonas aeruginosa]
MQLKKYTDYGLRILMYLGAKEGAQTTDKEQGQLTRIRDICDTFDLSVNHVNKVVHHLGRLNLIETRRGKNGGFLLAKAPGEIRLDFVIRQLEGDEPWIECHNPYCVALPACELNGIVARGKELFYDYLAQFTLNDLLKKQGQLLQIFSTAS